MPEAPLADAPTGTLMAGKRGLVMGVANDRSIAWGIARAVAAQGGQVALTYQGDALEKRVRPLARNKTEARRLFDERQRVYCLADWHFIIKPEFNSFEIAKRIAEEIFFYEFN